MNPYINKMNNSSKGLIYIPVYCFIEIYFWAPNPSIRKPKIPPQGPTESHLNEGGRGGGYDKMPN